MDANNFFEGGISRGVTNYLDEVSNGKAECRCHDSLGMDYGDEL